MSEPIIGFPDLANVAAELAARHALTPSSSLELLIDSLFGLSCRDQDDLFDPRQMAARRHEGFKLAKEIRKEAHSILASLDRLNEAYRHFNAVVDFNPLLLEAIFNATAGSPEEPFLPNELYILQTAFPDDHDKFLEDETRDHGPLAMQGLFDPLRPCPEFLWASIAARLRILAELPINDRQKPGKVANVVLGKAVRKCREFWVAHANRSWSMSLLKEKMVRQSSTDRAADKVGVLKGDCERFVADVLQVSGIIFSLPELASAWEAIDKTTRTNSPSSAVI